MKKNVMLTPLVGNDTLTGTSVDDRIDGSLHSDHAGLRTDERFLNVFSAARTQRRANFSD